PDVDQLVFALDRNGEIGSIEITGVVFNTSRSRAPAIPTPIGRGVVRVIEPLFGTAGDHNGDPHCAVTNLEQRTVRLSRLEDARDFYIGLGDQPVEQAISPCRNLVFGLNGDTLQAIWILATGKPPR